MVNDDSPESLEQLFKHYAWMQGLGVKWFNISLDDATQGVNASTQAKVVNEVLRRLRAKDAEAQMIFCPTFYWSDGNATNQMNLGMDQRPYLETLARELDPNVYLFWTGDGVVGSITRRAAESFRRISGHRLFLWDNYPVNDNQPAMHLGPVVDRDSDLCEVIDGYMSNPMCRQNQINRLPLATCADYAYNPRGYDPAPLHRPGHSPSGGDAAATRGVERSGGVVPGNAGLPQRRHRLQFRAGPVPQYTCSSPCAPGCAGLPPSPPGLVGADGKRIP